MSEFRRNMAKAVVQTVSTEFQREFGPLLKLSEIGLLSGLKESKDSQFLERLGTASSQKANIATYMMRERDAKDPGVSFRTDQQEPRAQEKMFIECGSTIVYFLGQFAEHLSREKSDGMTSAADSTVLTNSFFGLTSLVNLVGRVIPVEGNLDTKYFGFFPFNEEHPGDRHEEIRLESEVIAYNRIRHSISTCDQVVTTCSNFSFVFGPLVGSRANALTKHAIFACPRKQNARFVILLNFEKVIPFFSSPNFVTDSSSHDCYAVLGQPTEPTVAPVMPPPEAWWRLREFGAEAEAVHVIDRVSETDFEKGWFDIADDVRIIISLPTNRQSRSAEKQLGWNDAYKWLVSEMRKVNSASSRVRYEWSGEDVATEFQVVECRVSLAVDG